MSWLKFDTATPEKREVLAITVRMGWDDPDLTVGKLLRVWRWFDQHTLDGNAASVTPALLDRIVGVTGLTQAMAEVGWMRVETEGLTLPNFTRHNGATAKSRALTAARVANHRATGAADDAGNAPSVTGALAREEKKREEKKDPPTPRKRGKGFDASLIELPEWLDQELWRRWCKDRADRKKPITEEGARAQLSQLDKYRAEGRTPREVLEHAMSSGYQGLYPPAGKQVNGNHAPAAGDTFRGCV